MELVTALERVEDFTEPTCQHLSKKQRNVLLGIGTGVPVVTNNGVLRMDRARLAECLGQFSYKDSFANSGHTNITRPAIVEAILGKNSRQRGTRYIKGVGGAEDYTGIVSHATAMLTQRRPLVFRIVYGATEQASLRSVSYPLPAMLTIRKLAEITDVPSYLQIVHATNVSGTLNGLDMNKVNRQHEVINNGILRAAASMGVAAVTGFFDDRSLDLSELSGYAEILKSELLSEQIDKLRAKDSSTDLDASLAYVAAHYLLHDRPGSIEHRTHSTLPADTNVIDVGGRQEAYFLAMRNTLRQAVGETAPRTPFVFTRHTVPPYYMAKDGDIGLTDYQASPKLIVGNDIGAAASRDLEFMHQTIGVPLSITPHRPGMSGAADKKVNYE